MPKVNWLAKAIIIVVVLGLLVWFIQSGISNRPIVGYKLEECPNEITFSSGEDTKELSTKLGVSNSGDTNAFIILHFYGQNIEILNETKEPYNTINGTNVYVSFTIPKNSQNYYFGESVHFTIDKEKESFYYAYEVTKNTDKSISGGVNKLFGEIKGYYPIICKYKQETEGKFVNTE